MRIGITGAAGFIGMHLTESLLKAGHEVVGIDSLQPAYGGELSQMRSKYLENEYGFRIAVLDIAECEQSDLLNSFSGCEVVVHLAAWPGVRQGQLLPALYAKNNVLAFSKMIEAMRNLKPKHFLYASSSSIYGDLAQQGPVIESDATGLNLKSYYAATKWMNETEARATQELVDFPLTGLRFFTVYGPWGRPDMAYWSFLEKIKKDEEISLYGETGGSRNFTYIADCVDVLAKLIEVPLSAEHRSINIACGEPDETINFLNAIADCAKLPAKIKVVERPKVDVEKTWADLGKIGGLVTLPKQTPLSEGVANFVSWYEGVVQ
jgi:UDP-glucuronate 4-epimerase